MRKLVPTSLGARLFRAVALTVVIAQPTGCTKPTENTPSIEGAVNAGDTPSIEGALSIDDTITGDVPTNIEDPAKSEDATARNDLARVEDSVDGETTPQSETEPPGEDETPSGDESPGFVDAGHAYASEGVRGLGAWIDGFFSNKEYEAEVNESWMRLRLDGFAEQFEGADADANVRLHLKLPALDERLRVEVLSAGEADEDTASTDAPGGSQLSDLALDSITAALSYFFRNDEERSISARVGLDFNGLDPNPFIGFRYRENVELGEDWNFRFVQRFRYFLEERLESRTIFTFDRALEDDVLFRSEVEGTWLELQPDYFYSVNFAIFQPLDEKSAIEYQLLNSFRTSPHRLDQVTLRWRYRRQVWRDWLTVEAAPQLAIPRERDYQVVPGFGLRIEMTFGG